MAKPATEPTQKDITKILKKRERLLKAIGKKQNELNEVNQQIAQYSEWMKTLAKPQS